MIKKTFILIITTLLAVGCSMTEISLKSTDVFMGTQLPSELFCGDGYSIRDLYIEDVPGTKSYWLGPWVETIEVDGIDRFYIIKGYNRFYVNVAFPEYSAEQFSILSSGTHEFYGPFEGKPEDHFKLK